MLKFTKEHQWINAKEDGTGIMGITRYAADELGDINFIELPAVGARFAANQQLCVVESVKAASDVFMPVSCQVTAVNTGLETDPAPLNEDPEGAGWICQVSGIALDELTGLMSKEEYDAFVK